jgi:pyruvate/2-oxoglutarate dehydrogenase complex dihydrolipoamide dehydrogenase (E3) component
MSYDLVVIDCGPGGYACTTAAIQSGATMTSTDKSKR